MRSKASKAKNAGGDKAIKKQGQQKPENPLSIY
jgi:hypothetical protein